MADTKEVDEQSKKPTKEGLHGWKAAVAVFGCGTLAAFGVFGIVVALLGSLVSTVSSGLNSSDQPSSPGGVAPTVSAREEFLDDKFDLCKVTLPAISASGLVVSSDFDDPVDTSINGGAPSEDDLVRSGECEGVLHSGANINSTGPWDFQFSYRAIIYSPEEDRDGLSQEDLMDWKSEIESSGVEVEDSGGFNFLEEAYYVYGPSPEGGMEYKAVARKRSAVLMIELHSPDDSPVSHFESEVTNLEYNLDLALQDLIPA